MNKREKLQFVLVFIADLCALMCAMLLTWLLFQRWLGLIIITGREVIQYMGLQTVAFVCTFMCFDQKKNIMSMGWKQDLKRAIEFNIVMAALVALLLLLTKTPAMTSRYMLVFVHGMNLAFQPLAKQILRGMLRRGNLNRQFISLTGVVSSKNRVGPVVEDILRSWECKLCGVALVDALPEEVGQKYCGAEIKACFEDFIEWIRKDALDEVYVDVPMDSGKSLLPYLREIESMGVTINLALGFFGELDDGAEGGWHPYMSNTITHCAGHPIITLNAVQMDVEGAAIKRMMDIAGALVGSVMALIAMAVLAIPIKLESPGPLLFCQKRVGLNGRVFDFYKIRSMYVDAEERKKELMAKNKMSGLMFKMDDDPRITKIGKFIRKTSIDELPQFFNVLRGDMSLVGTRPPTLDEYEHYQSHHKRRLSMKPGITGLWQVSGRSNIEDFEEVVRLDVEYIDNWSIWADIKLLFRTVAVVFTGKGAE